MNETDLKILRILQQQPTIAVADLAQEIGLSQTPCWRRLKKLESDGFIARKAWTYRKCIRQCAIEAA
jgi:Lrp/AsnC family transcriptional regulator